MVKLNLIVIQSKNPETTVEWYSQTFGINFMSEKHGDGILHYSAQVIDGLIEIYPAKHLNSKITFGFTIDKSIFEKVALSQTHKTIGENIILIKDFDENSIVLSLSEHL